MGRKDGEFFNWFINFFDFFQTTLVECWNKLDGNVGELSSWVATKVTFSTITDQAVIIICARLLSRSALVRFPDPLVSWGT